MKDIRMQRLSLKNFKGIASFDFVPGGEDAAIYGDNATGKTTLVDAFMWLLFNKDSLNQAAFEIKPLSAVGEPAHGIEHGVEAQLNVSGKMLTLRKVLSEKWTKKRGSATKEFTGHTTDYFVDRVPKPKKDFDAAVAELCDEQLFRLLTNPRYFNEVMHWQKRRELLLQVCGDITDQDIISSDDKLSPLSRIMAERSLEDHKKMLQARRSELNKELEKIPVRIDECRQMIGQPPEMLGDMDLANLKNQLTIKQNELARLQSGGEIAEKTKQLRGIEAQLLDIETNATRTWRQQVDSLTVKKSQLSASIRDLQTQAAFADKSIRLIESQLDEMRAEWLLINGKSADVKDTCPACGQALQPDHISQAIANFNEDKARQLAAINERGRADKAKLVELQCRKEESLIKAAELATELERVTAELEKMQVVGSDLKNTEHETLTFGKQVLEAAIAELKESSAQAAMDLQQEIHAISTAIGTQELYRAQIQASQDAEKRIETLKVHERQLAAEFEKIEQELSLLESFIRAKVGMLEERINSQFELVNWKLFEEQINGGLSEVCTMTMNGVPYDSLNNAARIQGGCDIVRTLQSHFKTTLPVWIDNRESISTLPKMECQTISLIVSEPDKTLRIETKQSALAA